MAPRAQTDGPKSSGSVSRARAIVVALASDIGSLTWKAMIFQLATSIAYVLWQATSTAYLSSFCASQLSDAKHLENPLLHIVFIAYSWQ